MILFAVLLLQTTPAEIAAWDGLPIPDAVATPAVRYISCISDPVLDQMEAGETPEPAARETMMARTFAGCAPEREQSATEMDRIMADKPGWTDATVRAAKVERVLAAAEERVGFTTIDRERFLTVVECVKAGRKDCQTLVPAQPNP